ncbi:Hypothetical protein R9X50_00105300 [Acrodontium crateriforme]|uniref:Histone chaperone RTT106/FACT complex subunit SPT16-like middle domain-containing protein n=1 Tax=Acrodontium crateriforme TaxID=150365 RepID=A0AAQ3R2J2_9PEZI|nr:Hypothetical protein R9X50_00105300 [Acrodontium crateriforme]
MSADFDLLLKTAFPHEYPRLVAAVQEHPNPTILAQLFVELAGHVNPTNRNAPIVTAASKKRKLDHDAPAEVECTNSTQGISHPVVAFDCTDVSFQIPIRKKLKLQLVADEGDQSRQEIRLLHPQSNHLEYAFPAGQADEVFCLPVPEKQQRQWSFCVFPKSGATTVDGTNLEHIVFTLNETAPVGVTAEGFTATEDDTYINVTENAMNKMLATYGKRVVRPTDVEFASSIPQAHRKGEKAYHVKAHRGSKEGYLFFVTNGVVFGFKKPLVFFPFASIESISYTSVLQRTFNLVITTREKDGDELNEVEFSMLDQADFAGIDKYVERHGLNDASMAANRRAKAYNVNKEKPKKDVTNGGAAPGEVEDDERTELEKAEQQLQDEEDEEEEDYEASGGESDGEGEDTDEEEEYEEGGDDEVEEAEVDGDEE